MKLPRVYIVQKTHKDAIPMDNYNKYKAGFLMKRLLAQTVKTKINLIIKLLTLLLMIPLSAYGGSWQQNVTIGGFNKVHIYTPDSSSPIGAGKSLLIVLHGCVQPIDNFLTANLEAAAEVYGMVIAVPDAMNKTGYSCLKVRL